MTDLRTAELIPSSDDTAAGGKAELPKLVDLLTGFIPYQKVLADFLVWLGRKELTIRDTCLRETSDPSKLPCKRLFDAGDDTRKQEFTQEVHEELAELACTSTCVARGIIKQIPEKQENESTRSGMYSVLNKRLRTDDKCPGLKDLNPLDLESYERYRLYTASTSSDKGEDASRRVKPKDD
jgi:hypothetical protein